MVDSALSLGTQSAQKYTKLHTEIKGTNTLMGRANFGPVRGPYWILKKINPRTNHFHSMILCMGEVHQDAAEDHRGQRRRRGNPEELGASLALLQQTKSILGLIVRKIDSIF